MNILIIGTKSKLIPVYNYCKESGHNVVCIRTDEHENNAPILYFPKKDLAMAFFERTDQKTTCPYKGTSGYYSIVTKSQTLENIAWEFITPNLVVMDLLDYIAFVPTSAITIERL